MKLICKVVDLVEKLNIVKYAAETSKHIAIINETVLMEAANDRILLSCTNLEITIKSYLLANIKENGKIVLPVKILSGFLSSISGDVRIESTKARVTLSSGSSTSSISAFEANDYPIQNKGDTIESLTIQSKILKEAIKQVLPSVSDNTSRAELCGVHFAFGDDLTMAATDSIKLSEYIIPISTQPHILELPGKSIAKLYSLLSDGEDVHIEINKSSARFNTQRFDIITQSLQTSFPNYKGVIPDDFNMIVMVKNELMTKTLEASLLYSDKTTITFDQDTIMIKAESEVGEYVSSIDCEMFGTTIEIVLRTKLLVDILKAISDDVVQIQLVSNVSPFLIKPAQSECFMHLISVMAKC